MPKIFKVNERRQISLGKIAKHDFYVASVNENDEITLYPVTVQSVKRQVDPGASQAA